MQEAARLLRRNVLVVNAVTDADLETALATLAEKRVVGFIATPDVFFFREKDRIVAWASQRTIPGMYGSPDFPRAGGLMSYGTSIDEAYRQEGIYVGRILKGDRPADLPVQQALRIELVLNLKAAQALGLELPTSILLRADEVIE